MVTHDEWRGRPAGGSGRRSAGVPGKEEGSGSIWLLGIGLALIVFALGGQAIGSAALARHRAATAADLAALAGATRLVEGPAAACALAARVIAANGGTPAGCTVDGLDLVVEVTVRPTGPAASIGPARATARAGPLRA